MLAAVALVALVGCGSETAERPDPYGTPKSGGVLNLAVSADPPSLDPFTASNYAIAYGNLLSAIYDPLVWADPATGTVRPHVAESLVTDQTARRWTLTLRPEVTFSDGAAFDAAAVKANWEMHADPKVGSSYGGGLSGVRLTVLSPVQLAIELPSPNANFDRTVANGLSYIASPLALGDLPSLRTHPVGAGPFVLTERVVGTGMTLRRNPHYWQKGRPYLDGVDVRVLPLGKSAAATIADGRADLSEITEPVVEREAEDHRLGLIRLNLSGGLMLIFNTRRPPFNDPAARHAVVDSLDSAEMNRILFNGLGTPAKGVFDTSSPLANAQLTAPENRPDQAKAAFDRLTAAGTKPFRFTYLTIGAQPGTASGDGQYVQQRLAQFPNVQVKVDNVDTPDLIRRTTAGDFDLALSALWMTDPEPALYDFLSPGGKANTTGYSSPVVTEAMNAARAATDADARREAYTRVQVQLNQDLPFWVYREAVNTVVFGRQVTGVQPFGDGVVLFDRIGFRK